MKRRDLIRHLVLQGCYLDREGSRHSIYRNPANGRCAAVPRHLEIKDTVARTICD
jgi:mRNA interferase HicA